VQFFGNRAQKPNSNQAAFDENCKTYKDGVDCLIDYSNKCLEAQPAALAKSIMKSVKDHYNKRCNDPDYSKDFIEHNKCFEDPAIFEQFHQCEDKWFHRMQELLKLKVDVEKGIQSTCCIFHEFQRCISEQNTNLCHDKNARFWDDTLDEVSDDTVNIFCAQLKTSEQCSKNFPADMWKQIDEPVKGMDAEALKQRT
ncbi:PREDICTED: uncharacterized protein LOC108354747, partial [Rhagoletis zephyria]|uniref:uncharacterized protein LOC108354747 n=1 Tax=Rhagoletis zephyria TaxID=28612 RepID=UPI000811482C